MESTMRIIIWGVILLLFTGCGGGSNSNKETSTSIEMPQKLIKIPVQKNEQVSMVQPFMDYAIGKAIAYNKILPKIVEQCKSYAINEVCKIPKDSISITVTKEMIDELNENNISLDALPQDGLVGKERYLGETTFIRHDKNQPYQYTLTMYIEEEDNQFSWSSDKNSFFFSNSYKDGMGEDYLYTFFYHNQPDRKLLMHLALKFITSQENIEDNSNYYITYNMERVEGNPFVDMKVNFINEAPLTNEFLIKKYIEYLRLLDIGGVDIYSFTERLNSSTEEFYNNITSFFDSNAEDISKEEYCNNTSIECPSEDDTNNSITKLKIIGENLAEGKYFLLPAKHTSSKITMIELIKYQVGEFTLFGHATHGVLYDKNYSDSLDKLQIVYVGIENNGDAFFEVMGESERPVIEIKSL